MSHDRRDRPAERPDPTPGVRPSERATERLAADMRAEIGMTRAAWDDALLRSDERLHHDDEAGALASLEDQRRLLRLLEDRLQRTVAAAAAERDAEEVLAGVDAAAMVEPTQPAPVSHDAASPVEPGSRRGRLRALVAAGAATAVTAMAVGLAALAGPVLAPAPQIAGGPDGAGGGYEEPGDDGEADAGVGPADHGLAAPAPALERLPWLSGWARLLSADPSGDARGGGGELRPQGAADTDSDDTGGRDAAARDVDTAGPEDEGAGEGETGDDGTGPADEPESDDERLLDLETLLQSDETEDPGDGDDTEDQADGDDGDGPGEEDLDRSDEDEDAERDLPRAETGDRDTTTSTGLGW